MRRTVRVFALGFFVLAVSFGSVVNCPTSSPGSALDSFQPTDTPANGCFAVDVAFTDFSLSDNGSNVPAPATGDASIYYSGSSGDITALFDTPGSPGWSVESNDADAMHTVLTYTATSTDQFFDGIGIPLIPADYTYDGDGTSLQITLTYCLGQDTVTNGCTGGNIVYELYPGSPFVFPASATFDAVYNEIAVSESIDMQNGYTLLNLPNEFEEVTPEPSTFVLLGGALAGLGAFRKLRRRNRPSA